MQWVEEDRGENNNAWEKREKGEEYCTVEEGKGEKNIAGKKKAERGMIV